jgi:hypothetical protein
VSEGVHDVYTYRTRELVLWVVGTLTFECAFVTDLGRAPSELAMTLVECVGKGGGEGRHQGVLVFLPSHRRDQHQIAML